MIAPNLRKLLISCVIALVVWEIVIFVVDTPKDIPKKTKTEDIIKCYEEAYVGGYGWAALVIVGAIQITLEDVEKAAAERYKEKFYQRAFTKGIADAFTRVGTPTATGIGWEGWLQNRIKLLRDSLERNK